MSYHSGDVFNAYRQALAVNIRKYRKLREISPDDMAGMLGMTTRNYYKMEQVGPQQVLPAADRLPLLASIFGISLDELCGLAPPTTSLSSDEGLLLQYFRKIPISSQDPLIQIVRAIFVSKMSGAKVKRLSEFLMVEK